MLLVITGNGALYEQWLGDDDDDDDRVALTGMVGGCEMLVAVFEVVKHLVLKLLPMQTTMTFELLLFDCVDCVLSVL